MFKNLTTFIFKRFCEIASAKDIRRFPIEDWDSDSDEEEYTSEDEEEYTSEDEEEYTSEDQEEYTSEGQEEYCQYCNTSEDQNVFARTHMTYNYCPVCG